MNEDLKRWHCGGCGARFYSCEGLITHQRDAIPVDCQGRGVFYEGKVWAAIPTEETSTNPKDLIGSAKLPLGLFPVVAIAHGALALFDGKCKYGENNYRATPVRASIYLDAALRHLHKLYEGEDVDPESGVTHAGHILASLAIYLDAEAAKTLIDDRKFHGTHVPTVLGQLTSTVPALQAKHADKAPRHYTIQDTL